MRKTLIFSAMLAIATLATSCLKTDFFGNDNNGSRLVQVSPAGVRDTKAVIDGTTFPDTCDIVMSAYYNATEGDSGNYFSNITFSKSGSTWSADKYWPLTGNLDFLAISYNGLTISDLTYSDKVTDTVSFNVPDNSAIQTDILHSSTKDQTYQSSGTPMTFKHAEAVLVWTAGSTVAYNEDTNVGVTIRKITLKDASYSGKVTITAEEDNGYCTWTDLGSQKDKNLLTAGGKDSLNYHVPDTPMDITSEGNHLGIGNTGILVPEQAQTSFTIYYTLHNGKDGAGVKMDTDMQHTYTCAGNWSEGKKYNYVINFNVKQIQIAPTVTDWIVTPEDISVPEVASATYSVTAGTDVSLPKGVLASNSEVMIDWGDGAREAFTNATKSTLNADTLNLSHTYSPAFTGKAKIVVRKGSIDFGEVESSEFEKFTVIDGTKVTIAEKQVLLLPGVFTVNGSGKKVKFSRGNLMANVNAEGAAVTEWKLADHQYDYVGDTQAQQQCKGGWVDLFGWTPAGKYSDGVKQYGINTSNNNSDYVKDGVTDTCCDWGSLIGSGMTMLNSDEWQYLINNSLARTTASPYHYYSDEMGELSSPWKDGLYTEAEAEALYNETNKLYGTFEQAVDDDKICDNGNSYCFKVVSSFGCILKPDGFTGTVNSAYTAEGWAAAEKSGLVFLPLVGYRDGSNVYYVGYDGYCWSSTPYEGGEGIACHAYFYYDDADVGSNVRSYGYSVRLVSVQ